MYGSELFQIHSKREDNPREMMMLLGITFNQLKTERTFAKRVFDVDPSQWPRTVLNQLRTKAIRRSTEYANIRQYGHDLDDYEKLFSRAVGNHAYIGKPQEEDYFIRLLIVDETKVICDDRDIFKLDKFLERFV